MKRSIFSSSNEEEIMSSINLTSLIDVSLVVLIMFILIAPIMEQGINLNLPKAVAGQVKAKDALTVEVDAKGQIYLDLTPVNYHELELRMKSVASLDSEQAILIRADQNNKYGDIVRIIDIIKSAGLTKVGILTRSMDKKV